MLKRRQYLHFYFSTAELCSCSLNGEYSEAERLSRTVTVKFSLLFFRDMLGQLLVPVSDSAVFIYHTSSPYSVNGTKPAFSVFPLLVLEQQFTNECS